jgi:hypothetical protein
MLIPIFPFLQHFRHQKRRRSPLLMAFGTMLLVALCLLLASPLSAVELLSRPSTMTSAGRPHQNDAREGTPHLFDADAAAGVPSRQRPLRESGSQKPLSMADEPDDRPPVADLPDAVIADLPAEHAISSPDLATESKPGKQKRLVFVGDVHGRLSALRALLEKIDFDHRHGDHLVFAGDIVTKGPDSAGVLKLAMDVGASGVRGNHDDNVLLAHKALQKKKKKHHKKEKKKHHKSLDVANEDAESEGKGEGTDTERETVQLTAVQSKHADHARAVARSLSPKQIKWLSSLPIALRIGRVSNATSEDMPWNAGEIVVVHAGLVPGVPLEQQDPWAMMNMRTLLYPALKTASNGSLDAETPDEDTIPDETLASNDDSEESTTTTDDLLAVPSDTRHGEPWAHAWNRHQNTAFPTPADRTIVIYGHDARAGLQADVEITVQPWPTPRRKHKHKKKKKHPKRTDIEVEIAPETEVEIEIEVEDNSGNGTASGDPSLPSDRRGLKEERAQDTDINVEINTEVEVAVEVNTEIEIEIETEEVTGNGTATGDPSLPSNKHRRRAELEAEKKKGKKTEKKKGKKKEKGTKGIRYAFGIDSGCGHGRQLTALVLEAGPRPEDGVFHRIEQVECGEDDG